MRLSSFLPFLNVSSISQTMKTAPQKTITLVRSFDKCGAYDQHHTGQQFINAHGDSLIKGAQWVVTGNDNEWKAFDASIPALRRSSYDWYRKVKICENDLTVTLPSMLFGIERKVQKRIDALVPELAKIEQSSDDALNNAIEQRSKLHNMQQFYKTRSTIGPAKNENNSPKTKEFVLVGSGSIVGDPKLDVTNRLISKRQQQVLRKVRRARKPHNSISPRRVSRRSIWKTS